MPVRKVTKEKSTELNKENQSIENQTDPKETVVSKAPSRVKKASATKAEKVEQVSHLITSENFSDSVTETPQIPSVMETTVVSNDVVSDIVVPPVIPVQSNPIPAMPVQSAQPQNNGMGNNGNPGYTRNFNNNRSNFNNMNNRPNAMGQKRPMRVSPSNTNQYNQNQYNQNGNGYQNAGNSATNGYGYNNGSNGGMPASMNAPQMNNDSANYTGDVISIKGMLEILPEYGVIRQETHPYDNPDLPKDVYISQSQIRRFNLRMGDAITGFARPPKEGERYLSLLRVDKVEGMDPDEAKRRPQFSKLTPIFPNKVLKLETTSDVLSTRLMDLVTPIGKGQRAMVVAPPKAGKTWLLKDIANGITTNHPEVTLLVALIGERPEEVTHFSRSVKGEVFASNFDEKADEQTRMAEICLERAKRLAEAGKDVVILMDSITRLARAYNMVAPPSGRTLTGGFDPAALYPAKHFFGAARNFEEGGSLTIIATALVDTGSRMDDVIFEEFKGTGNMELRLDRTLYERRVFPTIDIKASGTRHDEHLLDKETFDKVLRFRRMVDLLDDREATELVLERLKKSKSNKEFLDNLHKGA